MELIRGWLESKREVAIKKISFKDYSILEEELMIKCDSHANLIRYYCKVRVTIIIITIIY